MRVLLSAYACEPDKGSEPEVGWRWAVGLANCGHQVWVITRENNRAMIEAAAQSIPPGLTFEYFDLPRPFLALKRLLGINFYYRLWQSGAFSHAKRLHQLVRFERTHHVTFVSARHPSFLRFLDAPFILGPVSGGEDAPPTLLAELPWRYRYTEWVRTLATRLLVRTPSVRATANAAAAIYATSVQSAALFTPQHAMKIRVRLAITSDSVIRPTGPAAKRTACAEAKFLYAGNLHHFKGVHLALRALQRVRRNGVAATLTIVGDGPAANWLRRVAAEAHIDDIVKWVGWVKRSELGAYYASHDAFVFPSLRDSGGMVVMEAMAHGLPIICLDSGGPGVVVDSTCGFVIRTDQSPEHVVTDIAVAMTRLASEMPLRAAMGAAANRRLDEFSQSRVLAALGYLET